jgi:hypothetical protein
MTARPGAGLERCRHGDVRVTVSDLVRICRALVVEPVDVVALTEPAGSEPEPAPLVLDDSGRRHVLVLRNAEGRCPFLLQTNDGYPLCGLGSLAPAGCWTREVAPDPAALDLHREAVTAWNAYAGRWPPSVGLDLEDVGRYLLDAGAVLVAGSSGSATPGPA